MNDTRRFEEFFDRIIDIFKETTKEEHAITPVEFKGMVIDLPRKKRDYTTVLLTR